MTTQTAVDVYQLSAEWANIKAQLDSLKSKEMELRGQLVTACFPVGTKEGTNTFDFNHEKWQLKATQPVTRELDIEQFRAAVGLFVQAGITDYESLVDWKPSLKASAFKELTDVQQNVVAGACLTLKMGSPQVKIVQSKR